jgi:signal transduction histidine kinase
VRRTIRFRVTAIAVVLSALLLTTASVLMVVTLRRQLTDNLDEGLDERADALTAVLAGPGSRALEGDEDLLVQAVDASGSVLASSANLVGRPPITETRAGLRTVTDVPGRAEHFRVLVRPIGLDGAPAVLIVGVNDDDVTDPVTWMTRLLAVAAPLMVALLGALTWWLTGRTLRPVERMRRQLADITATNVGGRVAEPATGDEIDRLAHTMNKTLDRLEGALQQQRRFVADASHELRSPLTRIRGELEVDLAAGAAADPVATERNVLAETVEVQRLVDDLLQLARNDEIGDPDSARVDLDDIVFREARRVRERGRVILDVSGVSAAQTIGDARQLARLTRNLLENAERHAVATVTITLAEADGRVRLAISDDGPGIPPEHREAVFGRFARLDDARSRDAGGTGLGLAIVRSIVERHGGAVYLDEGQPTRFVVDLPRAP